MIRPATAGVNGPSDIASCIRRSTASAGTSAVTVRPSASVSVTPSAELCCSCSNRPFHESTGCPFTAVTLSPRRSVRKASAPAGIPAESTNPMTVTGFTALPFFRARPLKMSHANSVFIVTPARMTIIRFHTGFASNMRSGGTCASGVPPSSAALDASSSRLAIFT